MVDRIRIVIFLIIFLFPTFAFCRLIHVPADYETIQEAIVEADDGDEIIVAPGRYIENINYLGKNLLITSRIFQNQHPCYIDSTIIDGDENGPTVTFSDEVNENARLRGFTITGGHNWFGGGIRIEEECNPVLEDLRIIDNSGLTLGGGIFVGEYSEIVMRRCTIEDNYSRYGGGIGAELNTSAVLEEVVILNNEARFDGGGIYTNLNSSFEVNRAAIVSNYAGRGGGIFFLYSHGNFLDNVTITHNRARAYGGIYLHAGAHDLDENAVTLTNCIVWGNEGVQIGHTRTEHEVPYTLTIRYSDVQNGENGIVTENGAAVDYEENNIEENPDFADPDNHDFRLLAGSPCIDAGDPESPEDADGSQADMGYYEPYVELVAFQFTLRRGWSIISINVMPERANIEWLMEPLVMMNQLRFIKDGQGHFYAPDQNFSNLDDWDIDNGYQIFVREECNLTVTGQELIERREIPMREGWNLIAYHPHEEMEAEAAFRSIREHLLMVKDQNGRFWIVAHNFSNLPLLETGQGYLLKVSEACDLVFPEE